MVIAVAVFLSLISNSAERSEVHPSLVAFTLYLPTGRFEITPSVATETPVTTELSADFTKV